MATAVTNLVDGNPADAVGVELSWGRSSSRFFSVREAHTAAGSTLHADGNVNLLATEGDLQVRGSDISAGGDASLTASKGNILLEAAQSDFSQHTESTSSSSSFSVGYSLGSGWYVGVSASGSEGTSDGEGTTTSTRTSLPAVRPRSTAAATLPCGARW
jgi:filamentous hemagglutinin